MLETRRWRLARSDQRQGFPGVAGVSLHLMMHPLHAKYDTELASESSTVAIDFWKGSFDLAHMMRFERSGGFRAHRRLDSL